MTDNRTTERVDHPPRVREAIDELMRKKDVTTLAIIDWLRQNDTEALVDRIGCGVYSKCECCGFAKYIGYGSSCLDAWKAMGSYIENWSADKREVDVDRTYVERIEPRLIEGTPTEDIRRWSVLAHSVMEVSGPSPLGTDGSLVLWLHESSLTQLLDMCDAVDEKFSEVEKAATLGNGTLTAEQVRESWCGNLKRDCLYDPPTPDWQAIADELNARAERTCRNTGECRWFCCSECGFGFGDIYINNEGKYDAENQPRFCPNCGARIEVIE